MEPICIGTICITKLGPVYDVTIELSPWNGRTLVQKNKYERRIRSNMDKCVEICNDLFYSIFMCTIYFKNTHYKAFSSSKSVEGEHGPINGIDTKANCCNLTNLSVKGLCGRCLSV